MLKLMQDFSLCRRRCANMAALKDSRYRFRNSFASDFRNRDREETLIWSFLLARGYSVKFTQYPAALITKNKRPFILLGGEA